LSKVYFGDVIEPPTTEEIRAAHHDFRHAATTFASPGVGENLSDER
jgi:hypothetical protein